MRMVSSGIHDMGAFPPAWSGCPTICAWKTTLRQISWARTPLLISSFLYFDNLLYSANYGHQCVQTILTTIVRLHDKMSPRTKYPHVKNVKRQSVPKDKTSPDKMSPRTKRPQDKTSPRQNVPKTKHPQDKTSTRQNVPKTKCHQDKMSPRQNVPMTKRPRTKCPQGQNVPMTKCPRLPI